MAESEETQPVIISILSHLVLLSVKLVKQSLDLQSYHLFLRELRLGEGEYQI